MGSTAMGRELDVWGRMETRERVPIASTPVASRSPVMRVDSVPRVARHRFGALRFSSRRTSCKSSHTGFLNCGLRSRNAG